MANLAEGAAEAREQRQDYIQSFDELSALGGYDYDGQKVSFQPWHRYEGERQIGQVRLWEENADAIAIMFKGSKAGVPYPDSERITRDTFEERKDTWRIIKL